jgi:hypothetical protein
MRKTIFTTVVWGDEFTFHFVNFCLPSLLSPGNLPALLPLAPVEFWIYTSQKDGARIEASPAYGRLRAVAATRIINVDDASVLAGSNDQNNAYALMVQAHRHAVQAAWEQDAAIAIVYPDTILGDGSFAAVAKRVSAGKRAVMCAGVSVTMQTFCPALIRAEIDAGRGQSLRAGELTIAPRPTIALALGHLHDHTAAQIVGGDTFTQWPSLTYWPLPGHGLLLRAWHLAPFFIHPSRDGTGFRASTDGDFVMRAVDWEECAVIEDSDEFMLVEPVSFKRRRNDKPCLNRARPYDVAHWAFHQTDAFNRRFARHRIWLHDGEATGRPAVEAASDAFMDEVFAYLEATDSFAADMAGGYAGWLGQSLA